MSLAATPASDSALPHAQFNMLRGEGEGPEKHMLCPSPRQCTLLTIPVALCVPSSTTDLAAVASSRCSWICSCRRSWPHVLLSWQISTPLHPRRFCSANTINKTGLQQVRQPWCYMQLLHGRAFMKQQKIAACQAACRRNAHLHNWCHCAACAAWPAAGAQFSTPSRRISRPEAVAGCCWHDPSSRAET